ncbi:MAG: hypothetical protein WBA93_34880 [Microcoleaceae cyanobacterium]
MIVILSGKNAKANIREQESKGKNQETFFAASNYPYIHDKNPNHPLLTQK